jgi:hypothetical protein
MKEQIAQSNADIQEAVQEVMRFADEEARDGTQTNQKSSFEEQVARSEAQLSNYEKPASCEPIYVPVMTASSRFSNFLRHCGCRINLAASKERFCAQSCV